MVRIRKDKNWDEVKAQLQALKRRGGLSAAQVLKQVGLKGEEIIVGHIVKQDLGWKDLSPLYKSAKERKFAKKAKSRKKKREAPTQKILIDTSTFYQSITSFAKNNEVHVGVPAGDKYTSSGRSVAYVASVHEYGSIVRNIPARPLFRPSREELKNWCKDNRMLANLFISDIKNNAI